MLQYVSLVQNQPAKTSGESVAVVCTPILHNVIAGMQKVYSAIQVCAGGRMAGDSLV